MRAVLDTNILVSAFLYGGIPLDILHLADTGVIEVATSETALSELHAVLGRPKFRSRFHELGFSARTAIQRYRQLATSVETIALSGMCEDPADDEFIGIAIASEADVIVSGDRHLLDCVGSPIPVVSASEFLSMMKELSQSQEDPVG